MIQSLLVGSGLLLLFSPWMLSRAARLLTTNTVRSGKQARISYQAAIADLANVRKRLIDTQQLADPVKAAIDTLTLALVAGSDE